MKKKIMKKYFMIIIISVFIIIIKLNAQDWVNLNPIFDSSISRYTYYGYFVDEKNGWWNVGMAGPGYILHTSNGGITWSKQLDNQWVGCVDLKFIDSLHGWYLGTILSSNKYYIFITKDGGKTWSKYSTPSLGCLFFFDSLNGYAGGSSNIYSTIDGGVTWQAQTIEAGVQFGIWDIFFVDKNNGWAVGASSDYWDAGIILNTTNGGKLWKVIEHPSDIMGTSVRFTDTLQGCIVGDPMWGGTIYITYDGGATWNYHYIRSPCLRDVVFTNDSTGWAVGDNGFIWHTTDRGFSWNRIESGTTSHLYRIFFFDDGNIGYILGGDRTLLKYDKSVGIKEEHLFKELSFELCQNYPNPFNSQTVIDFLLPKREYVTIEVYDILGRRVRTLANEFRGPGKHSIIFDSTGLSSGIYFYKLKTLSFTIIKKMILIL